MRSVILITAILMFDAINPEHPMSEHTATFLVYAFIAFVVADVIELFK